MPIHYKGSRRERMHSGSNPYTALSDQMNKLIDLADPPARGHVIEPSKLPLMHFQPGQLPSMISGDSIVAPIR